MTKPKAINRKKVGLGIERLLRKLLSPFYGHFQNSEENPRPTFSGKNL